MRIKDDYNPYIAPLIASILTTASVLFIQVQSGVQQLPPWLWMIFAVLTASAIGIAVGYGTRIMYGVKRKSKKDSLKKEIKENL